jgi:hypothetical protein
MNINQIGYGNGVNPYAIFEKDQQDESTYDILQRIRKSGAPNEDAYPSKAEIRSQVQEILSGIEPSEGGKVTLDDVVKHRDEQLEGFENKVKQDLVALGVDENIEFTLTRDRSTGQLVASGNHEDIPKVQQYLDSNHELTDVYGHIQTLMNVTSSIAAGNVSSISQAKMAIQAIEQAMVQGGGNRSLNGVFSGGSLRASLGVSRIA